MIIEQKNKKSDFIRGKYLGVRFFSLVKKPQHL